MYFGIELPQRACLRIGAHNLAGLNTPEIMSCAIFPETTVQFRRVQERLVDCPADLGRASFRENQGRSR